MSSGPRAPDAVFFEVDPALPGRQLLERFLTRGDKSQNARNGAARVRLRYLDLPIGSSWPPGTMPLFAIRCPLVASPRLQPYLTALGPDLVVGMLECDVAARRP
jgi:hypothetical protein